MSITAAVIMDDCNSSSVNIDTSSESENEAGLSTVSTQHHKFRSNLGKVTVVTPEVAAALDRTNMNDRKGSLCSYFNCCCKAFQAGCGWKI